MQKLLIVIVVLVLVVGLVMGLLIARIFQIQKVKHYLKISSKKGIEEEQRIQVGGIKQYLNIRGEDISNPMILLIHGSMPMTSIIHAYQRQWEKDYTVVNWDRRGCGETYYMNKKIRKALLPTLNVTQLIKDTDEVVDYLRSRFQKEKIIIVADSEGTTFAPRYVQAHPDKVLLYVGSAQVNEISVNLKRCKEDLTKRAYKAGNMKDVKALMQISTNVDEADALIKSQTQLSVYAEKYITGNSFKETLQMIIDAWKSPYSKLSHMGYFFVANGYNEEIINYTTTLNLLDYGVDFKVPIILITGEKDWVTGYTIQDYYNQIRTPYKMRYTIEGAGHNALQTSPQVFYQTMHQGIQQALKAEGVQE